MVFVLGGLGFQIRIVDVASGVAATPTTLNPAMTADAGLVPWADAGIRHTSRWPWPRRV